jgi:TonB-linked SusC/RagA family outer membrane protein
MKKLFLLMVLFVFVSGFTLLAQTIVITGTVTSAIQGEGAIPGVTVSVKGTTVGTLTDVNGEFSISVPIGATTLGFSYIGMKKREVEIAGRKVIDIVMEPDLMDLGEVVVVGYGTATKQSFVGTATTIDAKSIQSKSISDISQSLAGEAAGVQVINTSGQPGTSATIRIRGFGSVNGNRSPLYVVDGVPYDGSINAINPNDIESTTILKDATATAIYGSRGANGVILITTKAGKAGQSVIEVDIKRGVNVSFLPRNSTIKSPEQYIALSWEAMYNKGVATGVASPENYANTNLFGSSGIDPKYNLWNATGANLIDPATRSLIAGVTRKYNPENWEDYGFQNSSRTEANVSFRGGSETMKYYTSFGYLDDIGYIINSDFKRYTVIMNVQNIIRPWLTTNAKLNFAGTETNNNGQSSDSNSIFWFVDNLPPIFPLFLRDTNGAIVTDPIFGGNQYDYGVGRSFGALTNSIADAHFNKSNGKQNQGSGNFSANIKITESLRLENTIGGQFSDNKYVSLDNPFYGSAAGQGGYVYRTDAQLFSYNVLNLLRFKKSFANHHVEALVAHEINSWEQKFSNAQKSKMVHPDIDDLANFVIVAAPPTSYTDKVNLESYFGQFNYDYRNKYYLTLSARRDGTSRFIGNNKWDNFGSAGLSWVLTEEPFMKSLNFLNFLKYKVSYGITGEQAGVGYYPAYNTFDVSNLNNEISISSRDIGNPDLTWEKSKMFQTGFEFGLGQYLEGSLDYYMKNTNNLLFDRRVGPSVGYALITVNDGVLRNSGVEFNLTAHILNKSDYGLDITLNGDRIWNELVTMPVDPATGLPKVLDIQGNFGRAEGYSLFDFYVRDWAGVDPADGKAMWYQYYYDTNGNGVLDTGEGISSLFEYQHENPNNAISKTVTKTYANATQKFIGKSAIPKLRGAVRLNGHYKGIEASAQFIYSLGGYAYDAAYAILMNNDNIGGNNWSTDILDRWQKPGDITNVPRLSNNYDTNVNSSSTRFITSSNFLALNNVRIGYTFPSNLTEKIKISSLNVFVSGDNLFLLSARAGFNPSTSEAGTSDMYMYSPLSTFTMGLNVKF